MSAEALSGIERLIEGGDLPAARMQAQALADEHPKLAQARFLAGKALLLQAEHDAAAAEFSLAVQADPAHADALLALGRIHGARREFDDAFDRFSLVLLGDPDNAEAHFEMGKLQWMREEHVPAIANLRRATELDPRLTDALVELGYAYAHLRRFGDAIDVLERALALDPQNINALNRIGYALVRTQQFDRARQFFARVCRGAPRFFLGPRLNLANACYHLGDFAQARHIYEEILEQAPSHFETRWNRAHLMLAAGQFDPGWREYENRWMVSSLWKPRLIPFTPWAGQPLTAKALLVSAEQGLGDQIMFASCVPDAIAQAGRVILECERRLERLFRRSFPQATVIGSEQGDRIPGIEGMQIDYHLPLGSLPLQFRRGEEHFPRHCGYLRADEARIAHWRARLAGLGAGLKVGLSWRGGTPDTRAAMRSVLPDQLAPLLGRPGARFVSLQYGECRDELAALRSRSGIEIAHWPEAIDDYDETAALCCALDLTISVCTAVVHLNGALGRAIWVLVPPVPEWRYGTQGENMLWYPSVRLYRARNAGDWRPVLERVARDLGAVVP